MASMTTVRDFLAAADNAGLIYAIGGMAASGTELETVERDTPLQTILYKYVHQ